MGNWLFSLYERCTLAKDCRVLMFGLDAAGKTTLLYKVKLDEDVTTIPTIGFNVETVTISSVQLTMWDVGLRDKGRPLIRHYYDNTDALIFVIDSNDRERIEDARDYLEMVTKDDKFTQTPVLVFANKQDLAGAMSVSEITEKLLSTTFRETNRHWIVQPCVAKKGVGVFEGMSWLAETLKTIQTRL